MKKISIMILLLVAVLASCKKTPEVNLKYVDVERDLITVGTTTATVQCDYDYITTLKKAFFYYGEGEEEIDMNTAEMRVVQNTLYVDLTGLKENTTYGYYYEFVNGFNSMRSETKTFKTEAAPVEVVLPTVITAEVIEITESSAKGGGEVTDDGGAEVTERGICWGTNENPTLENSHIAVDSAINVFTATMVGLEENTTYHVRAYAINEIGTAYGLDKEFKTLSNGGGGNAPIGAINGLFTINTNGDKVYLSQGNLQYQASTDTWRFAEHQWDFVGGIHNDEGIEYGTVFENGEKCDNSRIASSYSGWIDLFGWGTSGFNHGAICYQPWSTSQTYSDYYAYGNYTYNLYDQTGQADWGYNPISNGGNTANQWRTLTRSEWVYVFNTRTTTSGIRYAMAKVNNVNGVILLPDNWSASTYGLSSANSSGASFSSNTITASQWTTLENAGAVFLPAAGYRYGTSVYNVGSAGDYWSASCDYSSSACDVIFGDSWLNTGNDNNRYGGRSVRLVRVAEN